MIYKEDVDRIIFRTRTEILELKDQLKKYREKKAIEINTKSEDLAILEELAPTLPEMQPSLYDEDYEIVGPDPKTAPMPEIEAPAGLEEPVPEEPESFNLDSEPEDQKPDEVFPPHNEDEDPELDVEGTSFVEKITGKDEPVSGSVGK